MKTLGSNFDPTALAPYDQSLAGQVYNTDAQCAHIYGNSSYMSRVSKIYLIHSTAENFMFYLRINTLVLTVKY